MAESGRKPHGPTDLALTAGAVLTGTGVLAFVLQNWQIFFWVAWILAFLAVELPAVFNARKGDTLSEQLWRWLRINGGRFRVKELHPLPDGTMKLVKPFPLWFTIALRVVTVGFGIWLTGHIAFGLWGGSEGLWFG
jgi:hypothetical protein